MRATWLIGLCVALAMFACGNSGVAPACQGATCSCPSGKTCDITTSNCGASCSLDCENSTDCTGACGSSCSLKCDGTATCSMTVGASGSVSCSGGSHCDITCVGSCSLSCSNGSTCTLKCPADSAAKPVTASGSCP